mgnify:CR=1 FL=1
MEKIILIDIKVMEIIILIVFIVCSLVTLSLMQGNEHPRRYDEFFGGKDKEIYEKEKRKKQKK